MSHSTLRRSIYFGLQLFASGAFARYNATYARRAASEFQADSSLDVAALYNFVKAGSSKVLATYPTCNDCDKSFDADLHGHEEAPGVITFMADMDIDCDGVNWKCPGNPDGQSQTTFGSMDTYQAPWYVLPDEWYASQGIVANNLGAVICNGKMFYAVFADSNGDSPQVIGETSLVLGNACFPDAGLSGAVGHSDPDIAYIVFAGEAPDGVGKETLKYGPLKELGDRKVRELLEKIGGGAPPAGDGKDPKPKPEEPEQEPEEPEQEDPEQTPEDSEGTPEEPEQESEEQSEEAPEQDPERQPEETPEQEPEEPEEQPEQEPETEPEVPEPEPEVPEPEPSTPSCNSTKRSNLRHRRSHHRRNHRRRSSH